MKLNAHIGKVSKSNYSGSKYSVASYLSDKKSWNVEIENYSDYSDFCVYLKEKFPNNFIEHNYHDIYQ